MVLIIVTVVVAALVVGITVFEFVGWLVERNARDRFEKMTPEERFRYQSEMRKAEV